MLSVHSVLTAERFMGGLTACMYFFAVARWMPIAGRPRESTAACASPSEQRSTLPSEVEWACRSLPLGRRKEDSNRREAVHEAAETTQLGLVGQPGLEPGTSVLSGLRSNRLSYWPFAPESSLGVTARHDEYSRGRPRVQGQVRIASGRSRPHYLRPDDCIVRCITGSRGRIGQAGGLVLRRRCPFTEGLAQLSGSAIRGWPFEISESCGGCSP